VQGAGYWGTEAFAKAGIRERQRQKLIEDFKAPLGGFGGVK